MGFGPAGVCRGVTITTTNNNNIPPPPFFTVFMIGERCLYQIYFFMNIKPPPFLNTIPEKGPGDHVVVVVCCCRHGR